MNRPLGNMEALVAGAIAGAAVDLTLYPLDTIKTRLQSQQGFAASGGFKRIYAGVPAIAVGSAPGAALFFVSYEKSKRYFDKIFPHSAYAHMTAAGFGEIVACLIRVPTEVIKQRAQASPSMSVPRLVIHGVYNEGLSGFYRGYWSTVSREIPFSIIEFPIWEYLKKSWSEKQGHPVSALQTAACGSIAGAIAAGATTPLDVAKTRIMLSRKVTGSRMTIRSVLTDIYRVKGMKGIFAGFWPRITWMALGGFVFFGAYDKAVRFVNAIEHPVNTTERIHFIRYCEWYLNMIIKFYDFILGPDTIKPEGGGRTFEDSLKEAEEVEKQRREYIEAAKRKFEGKNQI